jgi:hypothetical protein
MYKDYEIKLNAILDKHKVQKVELGEIQEVSNEGKKLLKIANQIEMSMDEVISKIDKLETLSKKGQAISTGLEKEIPKLKKDLANLGIKAQIKEIQQAERAVDFYNEKKTEIKKYVR